MRADAGLSDFRRTQMAFWMAFAHSAAGTSVVAPTPAPKNWRYLPIGARHAKLILAVSFRDGWIECKLAIDPSHGRAPESRGTAMLEGLVGERDAIERALGFSDIVWGDPTPTRIYRRTTMAVEDDVVGPAAFEWLIGNAQKFTEVFGPLLAPSAAPASPKVEDLSPPAATQPPRIKSKSPALETHQGRKRPRRRAAHIRSSDTDVDAGTIGGLFGELADGCDLVMLDGEFPLRHDLPDGAKWLALYSHEEHSIYRYAFALWWGAEALATTVAWVLLNPATGDTDGKPRPILTGCRHRSESWACTGLIVVNLFAYRARNPKELKKLPEARAVGPHNDAVLRAVTGACGLTIAAWGDGGADWQRPTTVRSHLRNPHCLMKNGKALTRKGQPFYPKGIKLDTPRVPLPAPFPGAP